MKDTPTLSKEKHEKLLVISEILKQHPHILSARAYGSWFYIDSGVDLDVGIIMSVPHYCISLEMFHAGRQLRKNLCAATGEDVDLVPHTEDEIPDTMSPLWHPRYNPTLCFGIQLKGEMELYESSKSTRQFGFEQLSSCVLHENRTLSRRQSFRTLEGGYGNFVYNRVLHGPANGITFTSCKKESHTDVVRLILSHAFQRSIGSLKSTLRMF